MAQTPEGKSVPYCTEFPDGLEQGARLRIRGSVPKDGKSFVVSFLCGREEKADNAFLLFVKVDGSSEMVLNSFLNKTPGKEEKYSGVPFAKGQDFQLDFTVEEDAYKVLVNEEETYEWKHRISAKKVLYLQVEGDVELQIVGLTDGKEDQSKAKINPQVLRCALPFQPFPCLPVCSPCVPWYCSRCYCVPCCCCW